MSNLPSGYRELSYIESTGTQFIRMGLYPLATDVIEIVGNFTNTIPQTMIGCHQSGYYRIAFGINTYNDVNYLVSSAGTWNENTEITGMDHKGTPLLPADTNVHTYIFDQAANGTSIDGMWYYGQGGKDATGRTVPDNSTSVHMMVLFAYIHDALDQIYSQAYFKLQSCKVTSDGTDRANYIPALRISDHKPGLYDTVTASFFTNAATTGDDFSYESDGFASLMNDICELDWVKSKATGMDKVKLNTSKIIPGVNWR